MLKDGELAELVLGQRELQAADIPQVACERLLGLVPICASNLEQQLKQETYNAVAWEAAHRRVVSWALRLFAENAIDALVIKGTVLAYTLYAEPWQRCRVDTDVFIRESQIDAAVKLLEGAGFESGVSLPGRLATAELAFSLTDEFGVVHTLDLHWRLNNNWRLAQAISFEELWAHKKSFPSLCPEALCPADTASLLIACVHRAAHATEIAYERPWGSKPESDLTLWIYDIHLLSEGITERDWQWVCEAAERAKLCLIVADGLQTSRNLFGTEIPVTVLKSLMDKDNQVSLEQMAQQASGEMTSLRAIPGFRNKLAFLVEQLFPAASYMKARYPGDGLLWAYVRRIVSGLLRRVSA
ncbi:MAG: nucleotidyltransferase family protein [Pseudomonadales bacterium]|nr:nucleotidyltransferase family protein [Pseudomonadales bacterium]MBO7005935.1 nucleotidyltransferase family protein [Pseudomonadales bacterium]